MALKIDLDNIVKRARIFACIIHKKPAVFRIETGVIVIQACCDKFHDHIDNFIQRQIELANTDENQEQI